VGQKEKYYPNKEIPPQKIEASILQIAFYRPRHSLHAETLAGIVSAGVRQNMYTAKMDRPNEDRPG